MPQPRIPRCLPLRRAAGAALTALALILAGDGCSTAGGGGVVGVASVTIRGRTAEQIVRTTVQVFGAEGYQGGLTGSGPMVFLKTTSFLTAMSREGLVAADAGARPIKRAVVEMAVLDDGAYRLRCSAIMVTGGGDPFFQEEKTLAKGPYQSLLNEVAKQLN